MLDVRCQCGKPIDRPCALLFGVPFGEDLVPKRHLCFECHDAVLAVLARRPRWEDVLRHHNESAPV
jgi:hypothetical protein